jgi:UPF0271 protein
VETQVRRLRALCEELDLPLVHVKPHGALYNMAARDPALAQAVAEAVARVDPGLVLYGLAGSPSLAAGRACGLRVAGEVFADRNYQADGSLVPRSQPRAMIEDDESAVAQALRLVLERKIRAVDGREFAVQADTLCLHGDGAHAVLFAKRLRNEFARRGIQVRSFAAC